MTDLIKNKYEAIVYLVKRGSRNSEWQEAELLCAIEEVIDSEKKIEPADIIQLLGKAANTI